MGMRAIPAPASPPRMRERTRQGQNEDQLEELRRLKGQGAEMYPAPRAGHHSPQHEHGDEQAEANEVESGRGAHEAPVVEGHYHEQGTDTHADPQELAQGEPGSSPPQAQAREADHAEDDDGKRGAQKRPIHVVEQPPVQPEHHPSSPSCTMATFSRKMA